MTDSTHQDAVLEDAIAIIGVAARFPGGHDENTIWQVLAEGATTETRFSSAELDPSLPDALTSSTNYVPVRGVLNDAECFDAAYFGISPREAEVLDPQQRVFLELAVHALEHAGYYQDTRAQPIGVFAGMSNVTYYRSHLQRRPEVINRVGDLNVMMGNEKDYLATRLAHKLDLTGPCVNVSTACSTAAVAVAQACQALQSYQCDIALAGGVSITTPQQRGYLFQEGSILSPDGYCRPFDSRAQGTYFSNGGGIIVCKRLSEALEDGDTIAAIVRGSALNNDGALRASFAAPGVEGQAEVITQALANADVDPADIGLVEAHGTATPIGDPIEVTALRMAYEQHTSGRGYCALGSIKSNIGHLDVAAGMAGIVKVILAMKHGKIPPTAHYRNANPELDIDNSPFFINGELLDWPEKSGTRLAGVSAFGSGGTNAHLILQSPPPVAARPTAPATSPRLIRFSARSAAAVARYANDLARWCQDNGSTVRLDDVAYSLDHGRREEPFRFAIAADSVTALGEKLAATSKRLQRQVRHTQPGGARRTGFVFPGQGAQYRGMGQQLYQSNPLFRATLDQCFDLFAGHLEHPLRDIMFSEDASDERINETANTQPAMFTLGLGLYRICTENNVTPDLLMGHSIGEYLAAHLAGVFSLEDAVHTVAKRGALMQAMQPGAMVAVSASSEALDTLLTDSVRIAAFNMPASHAVAGPFDDIAAFEQRCKAAGLATTRLTTSHAFHTPMMNEAATALQAHVATLKLGSPSTPIISTRTGTWMTTEEATSAEYWGAQIREPVRFSQAVGTLLAEATPATLYELGPRRSATAMIAAHVDNQAVSVTPLLDTAQNLHSEAEAVLNGLAARWLDGASIADDATNLPAGQRIALPGYAFERKPHYLPATGDSDDAVIDAPPTAIAPDIAAENGDSLQDSLTRLIADTIGIDTAEVTPDAEFVEMGFDSLMLTQFSVALRNAYRVDVPFRELQESVASVDALLAFLREHAPPESLSPPKTPSPVTPGQAVTGNSDERFAAFLAEQQALIAKYQGDETLGVTTTRIAPSPAPEATKPASGRGAAISRSREAVSEKDIAAINSIIAAYCAVTATSKAQAQANRARLADPRTVAGFNPLWKEAVYPIVTHRSAGANLWDVDDNQYIDFTCGFGPILLGHNPPFLKQALMAQLEHGVETGPQTQLAGEVAALICKATGVERVSFASTGTEAVMAATRIARTVSGRDKIVIFRGAYHGIHDEVTLGARQTGQALPGAPGIPRSALGNVIVAEYDDPATFEMLAAHASDIAAVLVEPVQSRHPNLQPAEFLTQLREVTRELDIALVFDEIVTGFRVALGGAQAYFDIDADIVTYGKVVGGGYPVGVVAGRARYLDALDGGAWSFGDDSVPEAGVTFFAGTFVRHPLMLAASKAMLTHLLEAGPALQDQLNKRTEALCVQLEQIAAQKTVAIEIERCSSWFTLAFPAFRYSALFYILLRQRGIFMWEERAFFLTTAHTDEDLATLCNAFEDSLQVLIDHGLLAPVTISNDPMDAAQPPLPGARLGRDPGGRPGWYTETAAGTFVQVGNADE